MKRVLLAALALLALGLAAESTPLAFVSLAGKPTELGPPGQGEALVVHFWASWCPTCQLELPALEKAASVCRTGTIQVVAVNLGEDRETADRYWKEGGYTLPLLLDPDGHAWRKLGATGLPFNLIWTQAGLRTFSGEHDLPAWRELLDELGCRSTE